MSGNSSEELEGRFNMRFDMALELTAVAGVDLAEAIDIMDSVDWDYGKAVKVTQEAARV